MIDRGPVGWSFVGDRERWQGKDGKRGEDGGELHGMFPLMVGWARRQYRPEAIIGQA